MGQKVTITRTRPSPDIPWYISTPEFFDDPVQVEWQKGFFEYSPQGLLKVIMSNPTDNELVTVIDMPDPLLFEETYQGYVQQYGNNTSFVTPGEEAYNQENGITVTGVVEQY